MIRFLSAKILNLFGRNFWTVSGYKFYSLSVLTLNQITSALKCPGKMWKQMKRHIKHIFIAHHLLIFKFKESTRFCTEFSVCKKHEVLQQSRGQTTIRDFIY